ncbi:ABC transporter permease [Fulvivirgaceae bacterium BMA10]|uniref:ABC transporter permease n=1 Tax=Splendidivirga corallicola TaxID=3051826 RepID=A0ABT8KK58_9BACT|nr:ABC transporter permease [Fulvivirgaceae bacterium BMA10]
MLKNYIKIALRNLWRNKVYSLINILGLTIGITCSCLLSLYLNNEWSFDTFHTKSDRIYRVVEIDDSNDEGTRYYGQTAPPVNEAMVQDFPEIVNGVNFYKFVGHLNFTIDGVRLAEREWYMTDERFFEIFDFTLLQGNEEEALKNPASVLLSKSTAKKYFGDENPLGKTIADGNIGELKVTGVFDDIPNNSHLQFNVLVSNSRSDERWQQFVSNWDAYGAFTYLLLDERANFENLKSKIPSFVDKHWGENPNNRNFYLQPLEEIYFDSAEIEFGTAFFKGEHFYVRLFIAIAVFLLVIASINYMNLATAKSMSRAKEIGMRKVSGAYRSQLVTQFLSESTIIALISFSLSIGLVDLLLPYFNDITGKAFEFNASTLGEILSMLLVITLFIGLISGSYPAFYLSSLKPSEVLKGEVKTGIKGLLLRKGLVVLQFSLSIIMIIATIVVYNQLTFIKNKEMGFDKEQMVVVDINNGNVRRSFETMKNEFSKIPGVLKVATSSRVPGEWKNITEIVLKPSSSQHVDSIQSYFMCFDKEVLDTYGFNLVEGANFQGNTAIDSTSVLLNETAARILGFDDPLGSEIRFGNVPYSFKVIGIVKDFHFQSLHAEIAPLVMSYWANPVRPIDYFSIKVDGRNMPQTISAITKVHEKFDDRTPIEYHFLDEQLELFYKADERAGKLFAIGAGLTIFIACLGLFGLASFVIQKRTKEISVRKALGASSINLFVLLSKTFVKQVLIAFVIASPVAYYIMNNWLEYFTYKVNLGVGTFLLAGLIALAISILTVSNRAIRATYIDPAKTLKNE